MVIFQIMKIFLWSWFYIQKYKIYDSVVVKFDLYIYFYRVLLI